MRKLSAAGRHGVRQLAAVAAYGLLLSLALHRFGGEPPAGALGYVLAVLPAAPIFAVIANFAFYLHEEADALGRVQLIHALLAGTGATLAATTVWALLERLAAVPHLTLLWVFPIFALSTAGAAPLIAWRRAAAAAAPAPAAAQAPAEPALAREDA